MPFCTASTICEAGHEFAGGERLDLKLVVGRFGDNFVIMSAPPYSVSSDFGQLVGIRHLISGIDCAIAGAATARHPAAAKPRDLDEVSSFH